MLASHFTPMFPARCCRQHVYWLLLVLVSGTAALAQTNPVDSLQLLLKESRPDTNRIRYLIELSQALPQTPAYTDQKVTAINQAIALAQALRQNHWLSRAYFMRGRIRFGQGQRGQTLRDADSALFWSERAHNILDRAEANNLIAIQQLVDGAYPKALAQLQRAEADARRGGDKALLAKIIYNKAQLYERVDDPARMLACFDEIEQLGADSPLLGYAYYGKLIHFYDVKRYAESITMSRKLLVMRFVEGNPMMQAQAYSRMGLSYWQFTKSKAKAESYIRRAIAIAETSGNNFAIVDSYWILGELYEATGEYKQADAAYQRVAQEISQNGRTEQAMRLLNARTRLYEKMGDYRKAFAFQSQFQVLKDSLFSVQKQQDIARLETTYQTRQKQNAIALLRQRTQLQETENQRAWMQRNAILASLLAVLVLAIGLFVRYRMSRENLRLAEAQKAIIEAREQEKSLLLQEMHHRIKNHLQLVMSLLGLQTYTQSDSNTKQVLRESRDRTFAVAMLHEQLYYQADDARQIGIQPYLTNLLQHLRESFDRPTVRLEATLEPLLLDVQAVVPLGLIVSEAVTNAYKYAFPVTAAGLVEVRFQVSAGVYQLSIADNGRGSGTQSPTPGFGLTLIEQLAGQLHGTVQIQSQAGFSVTVTFPIIHENG